MEPVSELCLNWQHQPYLAFCMSHTLSYERLPLACGLMTADGRLIEGNSALFSLLGLGTAAEFRICDVWQAAIKKTQCDTYSESSLPNKSGAQHTLFALCQLPGLPDLFMLAALAAEGTASNSRVFIETLAATLAQNRMTESSLTEARQQFTALAEQCPAGVYISENNLICFANQALAHLFRFRQPEDIAGAISGDDLVISEQRQIVCEQHRIAAQAGTAKFSFTAQRHDGTHFAAQAKERAIWCNNRPAILGVLTDISERRQLESELERRASCDTLTGLPNRTLLFDRLNQIIARARRDDELFALLFLDLDHFKEVNERSGQEVGNQVLRIAAGRFASTLRSSDTLARIGSDEFAVIAESLLFGDDVEPVAQKLCEVLASPIAFGGEEFRLGVSIGVALFPASGEDADALYRAADTAMQIAKETRRGSYVLSGIVK